MLHRIKNAFKNNEMIGPEIFLRSWKMNTKDSRKAFCDWKNMNI
jgi:hypothetical protein